MISKSIATIVRNHIRKEIKKHFYATVMPKVKEETNKVYQLNSLIGDVNNKIETLLLPLLESVLKKRILSGIEPVALDGLQVYFSSGYAFFDMNNIVEFSGQTIEFTSYSDDQWIYFYLNTDGTITYNKYAPIVGDNVDKIPLCKIFVEGGASSYDSTLLVDLRLVGFMSESRERLLRQIFAQFMYAVPALFVSSISVTPVSGMDIKIGSTSDALFYAKLTPIKDTTLTVPNPASGEPSPQDYIVLAYPVVDSYEANEYSIQFRIKKIDETIAFYEIPVAIIEGVEQSTTEITSDMIKEAGIQPLREDYYKEILKFSKIGDLNSGDQIGFIEVSNCLGKLFKAVIYLGEFKLLSSGGLASGLNPYIEFGIYKNGSLIHTIQLNYDETKENDIVAISNLDLLIYPNDIIKVKIESISLPSGYSFSISDCKIYLYKTISL